MKKTKSTNGETTKTKPSYIVHYVVRHEGQKERWISIGTAFTHQNGDGLNLYIDSLPINFNGKLVLRPPKQQDDQAERS